MDATAPLPETELLDRARALRAAGQWPALERLGSGLAREALLAEPELGFLYALASRVVGSTERALEVAEQVERAAGQRGDRRVRAEAANLAGIAHFEAGRLARAEEVWGGLLEAAAGWGDDEAATRASNNLGVLANVRGWRDQALVHYERALAAYQRTGNVRGMAETHHNLGISYRDLGLDREADAHFRRAIELAGQAGAEDVVAIAETERASLRARAGDGALAEAMVVRALERFERLGEPLGRADALRVRASAAHARSREQEASEYLQSALEIARQHADPLLLAEVQRDRGLLLRDTGEVEGARAALEESAAHFATLGAAAEAEAVASIARTLSEP
ncbi:tetratricopeptide repeat protein [Longimicrobium sp.]|uniref:tetratricopeptide repeat protein n=1 Tax=Longimicrobium sp. TaxID=2029185 RepID=UPI002F9244A2